MVVKTHKKRKYRRRVTVKAGGGKPKTHKKAKPPVNLYSCLSYFNENQNQNYDPNAINLSDLLDIINYIMPMFPPYTTNTTNTTNSSNRSANPSFKLNYLLFKLLISDINIDKIITAFNNNTVTKCPISIENENELKKLVDYAINSNNSLNSQTSQLNITSITVDKSYFEDIINNIYSNYVDYYNDYNFKKLYFLYVIYNNYCGNYVSKNIQIVSHTYKKEIRYMLDFIYVYVHFKDGFITTNITNSTNYQDNDKDYYNVLANIINKKIKKNNPSVVSTYYIKTMNNNDIDLNNPNNPNNPNKFTKDTTLFEAYFIICKKLDEEEEINYYLLLDKYEICKEIAKKLTLYKKNSSNRDLKYDLFLNSGHLQSGERSNMSYLFHDNTNIKNSFIKYKKFKNENENETQYNTWSTVYKNIYETAIKLLFNYLYYTNPYAFLSNLYLMNMLQFVYLSIVSYSDNDSDSDSDSDTILDDNIELLSNLNIEINYDTLLLSKKLIPTSGVVYAKHLGNVLGKNLWSGTEFAGRYLLSAFGTMASDAKYQSKYVIKKLSDDFKAAKNKIRRRTRRNKNNVAYEIPHGNWHRSNQLYGSMKNNDNLSVNLSMFELENQEKPNENEHANLTNTKEHSENLIPNQYNSFLPPNGEYVTLGRQNTLHPTQPKKHNRENLLI
jgi:hypothetical protein